MENFLILNLNNSLQEHFKSKFFESTSRKLFENNEIAVLKM